MKKIIFSVVMILIILSFTTAEKTYCDGWKKGYEAGYCYEVVGCVKPVVPVCPIAKIGFDKYQDGYNRGFTKGKKDQK